MIRCCINVLKSSRMSSAVFNLVPSSIKNSSSCHRQIRCASSGASTLDLSGIFPPICTPFNSDETIAYDKLKHNSLIWEQIPFRGYVVQGSNGEFVYLSKEERIEMVHEMKRMVSKNKLILAGSGCESTLQTIEMSQAMAKAGADAVLVYSPCFYKGRMHNEAMETHYKKVADNCPVPVILYNVPANTGIEISPDVIAKLAQHQNIIGLKDSGGDITRIANIINLTKDCDFQVLAGSAGFLLPAIHVGCVGGVLALANVLGNEICQMVTFHNAKAEKEALELQRRFIGPNTAVTRQLGVSALKKALDWLGYYGGPTRLPLTPLTGSEEESLRKQFERNGFL